MMLVVHPHDRTTAVLQVLYEGLEAQVVTTNCSHRDMQHLLRHVALREPILLLGHGSDRGLFYRKDDTSAEFDKIIVGHPHGHALRKHRGSLIGIWCHANLFAQAEGLHGLFSGMIISELSEAEQYGVATDQASMDHTNRIMFAQLRQLLTDGTPWHEIPERLKALDNIQSDLSRFNYAHFHYL